MRAGSGAGRGARAAVAANDTAVTPAGAAFATIGAASSTAAMAAIVGAGIERVKAKALALGAVLW